MRVAIPSDNERFVAAHTGRCLGFVIADVEDGTVQRVEYRKNSFTGHALGMHPVGNGERGSGFGGGGGEGHGGGGGHGHEHNHSHNRILSGLNDCQAMLALGMGPKLQQDLSTAGIEVFFTRDKEIDRVLQQLASGAFVSHPDGSACKEPHHG